MSEKNCFCADEEDVHQCGRCKEVFHSIDLYFLHKKLKTCKKNKAPVAADVVLPVAPKEPVNKVIEDSPVCEGKPDEFEVRRPTGMTKTVDKHKELVRSVKNKTRDWSDGWWVENCFLTG